MRGAAAAGLLYAARRYYRNWGTTKEECQTQLPGDDSVGRPAVQTTEGIWIDAPPGAVWPWLVQMGQGRGGLYSYQMLERLAGVQFPAADQIHPEWQQLAAGDVVRLAPEGWMGLRDGIALRVVDVIDERSIVLHPSSQRFLGDTVWSVHVIPRWEDRCRLLIRTRTRLHHPGQVLLTELVGPARAFITKGVLMGVKRRAERSTQAHGVSDTPVHRVI